MPEAINLTFIAGPADRQSTQGIDSDSAAAEIVGRTIQVCCKGAYRWLRAGFGAEVGRR